MKNNKANARSIAQKITRVILIVALCSSLIIGMVGIITVSVVSSNSVELYSQNLVPLTTIYKLSSDFSSVRVNFRSMLLGIGDNSTTQSSIESAFKDMHTQLALYEKNLSSTAEKENYKNMVNAVASYESTKNQFTTDFSAGNYKDAQALLTGSASKALDAAISKALSLNTSQAQQRNQTSTWLLLISIAAMLALIAGFLLIARRLSKTTAHRISDPINKMVVAANSISAGNLNVDILVNSDDETQILAEAFQKIITSLKLLKTDVNMLTGEAMEGRLDTRADLSRHNGDYREIIEGVNKTLDAVKEPLDVASAFVVRLSDGEHQEDIDNIYKGYYATLVNHLNDVRHSISTLVAEVRKLAQAGQAGELDVRGDDARLKGTYADIIHGVNDMFDSIKEPLDVASIFINHLAEGQHQEDIDNIYQGYYATLIENLNKVRHSIAFLLSETLRLANAGAQGELSVRGNPGELRGEYTKIINSFNSMLDSIVNPLNEAGEVLGKMAVNDFTTQMSSDYKGMLNDLSVSINHVLTRLHSVETFVIDIGNGKSSAEQIEALKKAGKKSENDNLTPSMIAAGASIGELIEESNMLAAAAFEGNLAVRGQAEKFNGGYRQIIEGMNHTMEAVSEPIEESSNVLQELASGNLAVEMTGDYKGEYNRIRLSINKAIDSFNLLLSEINTSATQVSVGSAQVSAASQSLSQGAAEQASSVEELNSSIAEIAAQTQHNASSAKQASAISSAVQSEAAQGNEKMGRMLEAMNQINEASTNISRVIKVIDDIAFQTNILALNAAVEAARAGQYGKGFAVVAEEVRNLAAKSAEAASETTSLIEGSVSRVKAGTGIANETAEVLAKIVDSAQKSAALVSDIAAASNEQATSITQIDQGISQVSTVVQTNSATAEEGAASSEELSGQANMLMEMVKQFKLKSTSDAAESTVGAPARRAVSEAPSVKISKESPAGEFGKY